MVPVMVPGDSCICQDWMELVLLDRDIWPDGVSGNVNVLHPKVRYNQEKKKKLRNRSHQRPRYMVQDAAVYRPGAEEVWFLAAGDVAAGARLRYFLRTNHESCYCQRWERSVCTFWTLQ